MAGPVVDGLALAHLDDLAEVHHRDPLREVPHDRQVVGDEDEGDPQIPLNLLEQVDDLGLDGDVQRRDRLVGHDQLRLQGQGAGDADPLALAAGELVREPVVVLGVEADGLQQLADALLPAAGRVDAVDLHGPADDGAHGVPRVQRRVRVLEDHLDLGADRCQLLARRVGDVLPGVAEGARGGLQQPGQQPSRRGLATARLADEPEALARVHGEVHPGDGLDLAHFPLEGEAAHDREVLGQVLGLQQRLARARGPLLPRFAPARLGQGAVIAHWSGSPSARPSSAWA
ncbi:hypothetical protein AN217_24795 [Streptomyces qinglanensis]|uniref:Uncharacterized protein n=1 Tax=Streptomyces qinglanensis TaxID=943816 RepID=A0A1E7K989_9ACTN|nr:hypothetical protein AN217_24795 [Streptomyces qinglanensis]